MNQLNIIRPVTVRAKVTEDLKSRLSHQLQEVINQLDQESEQLEAQLKRAQLTMQGLSPQQMMALRQQVEVEKQKRTERVQQIRTEIQAVGQLPIGSEIVQGEVQTVATVAVGDNWDDLHNLEILLEDGKVIAIRRGED